MQETNLYTITVPPMIRALKNLSLLIGKAAAHAETKGTERHPASKHLEALMNDRLVFDQFNFIRQVQVASDNAKGAACRLAGIEIPKYEDTEKTDVELIARIEKTLEFLKTIKPEQMIGRENEKIVMPYHQDKYLTGFEYATGYALPNFYFHITTAYSILRKNGVNIGKRDFIGELPLRKV